MSSHQPQFRLDALAEPPHPATSTQFLSQLAGYIDHLVRAADRRDWVSVGQLSSALEQGSSDAGVFELSGAAGQVASAARSGTNSANIRRALLRLIGAYGRVRRAPTACCSL